MKKLIKLTASIVLFFLIVSSCAPEMIKIGFSGTLVGKHSNLGIGTKHAVQIAVEEINEAGGINGRLVEIIYKNDWNDPEKAVEADQELINQGVIAIIGHMTSSMTMAVFDFINENKIPLISGTTSSPFFSGKDDYFFRVLNSSDKPALHLADYAFNSMDLTRIVCIYDTSNIAYTKSWFQIFKDHITALGGTVYDAVTYNSESDFSYMDIVTKMYDQYPDAEGVVFIARDVDTAFFCQQVKKIYGDVAILSSTWAKTSELLNNGGRSIEGLIFSDMYDQESKAPAFMAFKEKYISRYGQDPDFASSHAYEVTQYLFKALKHQKFGESLRDALKRINSIDGLQGIITFDEWGDADKEHFIITVQNGEFVVLK